MDMFKLLARSTNLQRSALATPTGPQLFPSAGLAVNALEHEHNEIRSQKDAEEEPRGTKRKRSAVEERNVAEEVDFFGGQGAQRKPLRDESQQGKELKSNEEAILVDKVRPDVQITTLSEEECRRILKKHKLKVTILREVEDAQKQRVGKKLKTDQKPQCKKDPHHQIWPQPLALFKDLRKRYSISSRLAKNLDGQGYRDPTEVQLAALPLLLGSDEDRGFVENGSKASQTQQKSDVDLLTVAPTGSGKTLAFLIPIIQGLVEARRATVAGKAESRREHQVQALIVVPTHELVDQIVNEARKLAVGTGIKVSGMRKGMRIHTAMQRGTKDGDAIQDERRSIKSDILVSTPLMMLHAISSTNESIPSLLPSVRYLVLDEADVLLDPLFREQTLGIWSACPSRLLQTTLWSATIGASIETLAQNFILSRRRSLGLSLSSSDHHILRLVVGLKDSAIPLITHRLIYAASEKGKLLALQQLLHPTITSNTDPILRPPFLVFTQTIPRAIALQSELRYDIPPEAGGSSRLAVLHADLSPTARSAIMAGLRKGEIWIVITTDLLSRGVDIRGLNGVVNYDIPTTSASYVHRVGRTGRQGREGGVGVTLYTKEDIPYVKNIANMVVASERAAARKGKAGKKSGGEGKKKKEREEDEEQEGGVQKWLLDALPRVSKKTRQDLKRKGVESRRAGIRKQDDAVLKRRGRISTKSGFERRMEDRRRGAMLGNRRRTEEARNAAGVANGTGRVGGEDEEWGGFDG